MYLLKYGESCGQQPTLIEATMFALDLSEMTEHEVVIYEDKSKIAAFQGGRRTFPKRAIQTFASSREEMIDLALAESSTITGAAKKLGIHRRSLHRIINGNKKKTLVMKAAG